LQRNVEFFATALDAVAAGYRACRRCSPDQDHVNDPTVAAVTSVCRWLEQPDDGEQKQSEEQPDSREPAQAEVALQQIDGRAQDQRVVADLRK